MAEAGRREPSVLRIRVPGLLGPLASQPPAGVFPRLPALEWCLARGRPAEAVPSDVLPVPEGPLGLLGDGGTPGTSVWSRAEPVGLQAEGSGVRLVPLNLNRDERAHLRQTVAEVLQPHGLTLWEEASGERWYVASSERAPERPAPQRFTGRFVDGNTPRGHRALRWGSVLSELEMILHDHPVSRTREQAGRPAPTTLWIWGSGTLAEAPRHLPWGRIRAEDPAWIGLARYAGLPAGSSESFDAGHAGADGPGTTLYTDETAASALASGDGEYWLSAVMRVEEELLAPALERLGRPPHPWSEIVLDDGRSARRVGPVDRWRVWRRTHPWQDSVHVLGTDGS